jgi:hypothetical protein
MLPYRYEGTGGMSWLYPAGFELATEQGYGRWLCISWYASSSSSPEIKLTNSDSFGYSETQNGPDPRFHSAPPFLQAFSLSVV